ncbi:MAG TPA: hypothetical protein VGS97_23660 [Actinocrinis sp.]|uniref:hypothetical protein n=1 Tax=Actinocrinis sp. TaxID=1920516 RepID=UPI002DDD3030|nr:hypothetical protein [Actinocrinis sp.]HEV2347116.1 hypothetical protein [Actinocrinis sp.]
MDRLATHVIATAVLTAALAAVPTAMANPSTDPGSTASKPSAVTTHSSTSAPPSSDPAATSTSAHVQPVPCADVRQIGGTSYARWHGIIAFSVKQFYSPGCRAVYGYAFPWLQFRRLRVHYDLGMGVFDATHDAIDGARTFLGGAGGPDFWSSPVTVPAGACTEGLAHVFYPDTETDTFTTKVCR